MKLINVNNVETNVVEIEFSIDRPVFEEAVTKEFKKNQKNITLPGFRKGKAPRTIIEKMYGKGVFYEDAINEVLPDAFDEALKESKLDMVGQPEFDIVSIDDNGVVVTAAVYVKPEVKLGDVNGNGEIDKYDYIMVKRNVMETLTLEDVQKNASDINGNGAVDKYDYILIKRHVMKTYVIEG